MTKTVVALYRDFPTAQQALQALADEGFQRADISLIAQDETHGGQSLHAGPTQDQFEQGHTAAVSSETKSDAAAGAGAGAVIGGLAGLVMGLSALAIPGIGPLIAAGPIATALAGAGLGTVTGGILGALADGGVPEEDATAYAEGIQRGGTLVAVRTSDERALEARDLLRRFGPEDIRNEERRESVPSNVDAAAWPAHGEPAQDMRQSDRAVEERERIAGSGMEFGAGAVPGHVGAHQYASPMDSGRHEADMDPSWEEAEREQKEAMHGDDLGDAQRAAGLGWEQNPGALSHEEDDDDLADADQAEHHARLETESRGVGLGHGEDTEADTFGGEFHWPADVRQNPAGESQEMSAGGFHTAEEPAFGSEHERSERRMSKHQMENSAPGMQDEDLSSLGGQGTASQDWTQGADLGTGEAGMSMQPQRHNFEGQDDDLYRGIAGSQHPLMENRGGQMASQGQGRDFDSFLPEYQDHFNMLFADRGQGFADWEPAYHYGYDLARMERYQGSHWSEIEPQASEEWERVFPDWPWTEAKDAVRHAWERAAGTQPPAGSGQAGHSRLEGYGAGPDQGYEQGGF